MKRFIFLCVLLAGCDMPPEPNIGELIDQCRAQYPIEAATNIKPAKKRLEYLLSRNDCEKNANITYLGNDNIDLINVAFSKKAVVYEKLVHNKMTNIEAEAAMNEINSEFYDKAQERIDRKLMMLPRSPQFTDCRPNSRGGFNCTTY